MAQFPNKGAEQVTLANWRTSPFNQWAFHHVREIVPTASIPNDTKKIQKPKSNLLNLSKLKILLKDKSQLAFY